MLAILFLNLICLLLLNIGNVLKLRNLMPGVIGLLIAFFSVRKGYGNDFNSYATLYDYITTMPMAVVKLRYPDIELGWIWLNQLFSFANFQVLVVFLTVVQFATVGWMIMRYVERKYQWMILGLYLFLPSLMVTELSMMRQALAMSVVAWSLPLLLRKKLWSTLAGAAVIASAMLFHKSAITALPLILLPYLERLNWKWVFFGFIALFGFFQLSPSWVLGPINSLTSTDEFAKYDYYVAEGVGVEMRTGIGFLFQFLVAAFMAFMFKWKRTDKRFFILSLLVFYVMTPLSATVGIIGRIGLYYQNIGIVSFTSLFRRAGKDAMALILTIVYLIYSLIAFFNFFYSPVWVAKFMHYTTIFD